jgi:hypothetical protein
VFLSSSLVQMEFQADYIASAVGRPALSIFNLWSILITLQD